jgi:hypothetical protein
VATAVAHVTSAGAVTRATGGKLLTRPGGIYFGAAPDFVSAGI